jgi:GT2 family glycosyltransferase
MQSCNVQRLAELSAHLPKDFSIVIPSHNRPELLRLCLASALRYAPQGTEILVVDDGSRDGVVSATASESPDVRVLRLPKRRGFCAAVNAGIAATTGSIIELLNDDTEVTEGWADAALTHFRDSAVGAVAPLVLKQAPTPGPRFAPVIDSAGDTYHAGGVARKRGHGRGLTDEYLQARCVFGASGSSAFYRRSALEKIGGFPESFGAYFEDVDLAFRMHWAGYRVRYEPASRVFHRGSSSHGPARRRLLEQQSRNEERVFWRNLPGRALLGALPAHAAVLLGKAWLRCQEGTLLPFLCGRLRVLSEIPELLRHRRALHRLAPAADPGTWELDHRLDFRRFFR